MFPTNSAHPKATRGMWSQATSSLGWFLDLGFGFFFFH